MIARPRRSHGCMVSCSQQAPSKPSERPSLDSRIPDFDAPSASCGVGDRKNFTAKDQPTSPEQPKSAAAEWIWRRSDGTEDILGWRVTWAASAGFEGHGFRWMKPSGLMSSGVGALAAGEASGAGCAASGLEPVVKVHSYGQRPRVARHDSRICLLAAVLRLYPQPNLRHETMVFTSGRPDNRSFSRGEGQRPAKPPAFRSGL